jgi:hypothetical protein
VRYLILACLMVLVGCGHAAQQSKAVETPVVPPMPPIHDPPLTAFVIPPRSFVPQERVPTPCGQSTTVKVGKLNINMPKGGRLEIEGIKTSTDSYSIVLEGVEFTNTHECK